jgi:NADPH2:quinone reductase
LKITRPTLFTHIASHDDCQNMARHLFSKVTSGEVEIVIGQEFALADVQKAHDALEGRATTGSTILTV